ncbi:MAG: putative phage holin [bacterium]
MSHADTVRSLNEWVTACLSVAAIATTSVPVLYSLSGWHRTHIGRAFMAQSIAFALAIDVTLLFRFWHPHPHWLIVVVTAMLFTAIAITTSGISFLVWKYNIFDHMKEPREQEPIPEQQDL